MCIARDSLEIKRKVITKLMDQGLFPYTQRYLRHWNNHFSTIGLVGMNESMLNFMDKDLTSPEAREFTIEVLTHMRKKLIEFQEQTGHLHNLEATPAEGTSYRMAKIDRQKFSRMIIPGGDHPYYTNSTQLPVNATDDLFEALDMQNPIQRLYTGGTVFHAFIGEAIDDAETCKKLVRKIATGYEVPYFTISPTFSVCLRHGYLKGEQFSCPNCGEETEVYSRIVGYYRPVQNWNLGKKSEYHNRKLYKKGITPRRRAAAPCGNRKGNGMRTGNSGIIGWAKNSFIDFPGTVSTVLFFSGCNLRCPYCHNPRIVRNTSLEEIPYAKVREFLEKRKGVIEGVVLSGGEPTMHPEILDIAKDIRSLGFSIKLDTNGLRPGVIRAVAPDYLALDIKTLPDRYVSLLKSPYADTPERLALSIKIAQSIGGKGRIQDNRGAGHHRSRWSLPDLHPMLQGARKVFLQPMQTRVELLDPEMKDKAPIALKELAEYREILLQFVDKCEIRGSCLEPVFHFPQPGEHLHVFRRFHAQFFPDAPVP